MFAIKKITLSVILTTFFALNSFSQLKVQSDGHGLLSNTRYLFLGSSSGSHRGALWGSYGRSGIDFAQDFTLRYATSASSYTNVLKVNKNRVWDFNVNSSHRIIFDKTGSEPTIRPSSNNWGQLGTNDKRWYRIYTNNLYVNGVRVTSDERKKKNIENLGSCLDKLNSVNGYTYQFDSNVEMIPEAISTDLNADSNVGESGTDNDTISSPTEPIVNINSNSRRANNNEGTVIKDSKQSVGFLAQELQKVFPELVEYDNKEDLYTVDYLGMIPILVEALKEQQAEIASLKEEMQSVENSNSSSSSNIQNSKLFQNKPNPFTEETSIPFKIDEKVKLATLYIYDFNGNQKRTRKISKRGKGSITLKTKGLKQGIYIYTLIADGVPVGTKRMMITK